MNQNIIYSARNAEELKKMTDFVKTLPEVVQLDIESIIISPTGQPFIVTTVSYPETTRDHPEVCVPADPYKIKVHKNKIQIIYDKSIFNVYGGQKCLQELRFVDPD